MIARRRKGRDASRSPLEWRSPGVIRRGLLVAGAAGLSTLLSITAASAYTLTGAAAAPAGLMARFDPDGASGSIAGGQVVATIPDHSTVYIDCYWNDAAENGPWGSTRVWDDIEGYRTPDGAYHDLSGYAGSVFVTDAWVDTGGDTSRMARPCFGY